MTEGVLFITPPPRVKEYRMATTHTRSRNEHGDPVLTITVVGWTDIFRLSWNHLHAQSEFFDEATKTFQWLRRVMGAKNFDAADQSLTGGKVHPYSTRRGRSL